MGCSSDLTHPLTQGSFLPFAGQANTGDRNAFFGRNTGDSSGTASSTSLFGSDADSASGLTNATAIGSRAFVTQSNSLVLGSINGINGSLASSTNVGIGTTAPNATLHISTNGGNMLIGNMGCGSPSTGIGFHPVLNCTNYSMLGDGIGTLFNRPLGGFMDFRENNVTQLNIAPGGVVRIFNLAAATATTLCRTALNEIAACTSSLRYKEKINTFSSGLDLIKRLRPVSFNWIGGGNRDLGLVAEEVAKIEPLLVTRDNKGEIEGVKYDRVGVVLINAVKELKAENDSLKASLAAQQKQVDELKTLVCLKNRDAKMCKQ